MTATFTHHLFIAVFGFMISRLNAVRTTGDYCMFDEALKQKFRDISCDTHMEECATKARRIAQENLSGSWGAITIANKNLVLEEKVDWFVHTVNPHPGRCRLVLNNTVLLELFRTGYRKTNLNSNNWLLQASRSITDDNSTKHEFCPHSALRELIAGFSINEFLMNKNPSPHIYKTAKNLAQAFHDETGQQWNVIITRNLTDNNDVAINFPHYIYDARSGICFGQTLDNFNVYASIIGFEDQHQEATSNG